MKSGAKAVGKEALRTGVNVLSDMVNAVPPNQAMGSRMKEFTTNLKRKADDKIDRVMKGSGYKRRKTKVTTQSLERLLAVRSTKVPKGKKKVLKKKKGKTVKPQKDIFG